MYNKNSKCLKSLIQRVFRLDHENDLKFQKEQIYRRPRELEQQRLQQEVSV